VLQKLYDLGLMGFVAGSNPYRIRFLPPPGITTEQHIDMACKIIEQAIS
jgi:acetylornithine aminotransferase